MTTAFGERRVAALSASKQALLAQRLRGSKRPAAARAIPPRPAGPLPLSPAQRALWLVDQLFDGNAAYTVHRTMWIRGRLDLRVLNRAADYLVNRHEVLRTTIRAGEQIVSPSGVADFAVVPAGSPQEALELAKREVCATFDLENGPLLRIRAIRV